VTSTPSRLLDGTADQTGCRLARVTAWLVAGSALVLATDRLPAQARDRVIVRQAEGRGRLTHVGQITDPSDILDISKQYNFHIPTFT